MTREPFARHPGDLVRMVLAAVLLLVSVLAVQRGRLSVLETNVFRLVNDLPAAFMPPLWFVMQLGTKASPILVGGVLAAFRQWRAAASALVAGALAWAVSDILKEYIQRGRPADFLDDLTHVSTGGGAGFVSGHTAVSTAMVTVLAPYLTRNWRRAVWLLPWLVGAGRLYTGAHLPLDVVGGFAVGWFVGAAVHMVTGTPRHAPTADRVAALLASFGLPVQDVREAGVEARSSHPFRATTEDGTPVFVKVLDPDPRDTDWILRLARYAAFREVRDVDALASLPVQAEHEAATTMAAAAAGVRVPRTLLARRYGEGAVVVQEEVPGRDLSTLNGSAATAIDDRTLREVWRQVGLMHEAHIAHRDLVRANVVIDRDGEPWIVDFGNAQPWAERREMAADVAELLASLSCAVGPARALETARAELGPDVVEGVLPNLELLAVSSATRRELAGRPEILRELRDAVGGVEDAGQGPPRTRAAIVAAIAMAATFVVLPVVVGAEEVLEAFPGISLRWVLVGAVLYLSSLMAGALAVVLTTTRRVSPGRTTVVQGAWAMSETVGGPRGRRGHVIRYLRRYATPGEEAARTADALAAAEAVGWFLAFAVTLAAVLTGGLPDVAFDARIPLLAGIAVAGGVAAWVLRWPYGPQYIEPAWLRAGWSSLASAARSMARPAIAIAPAVAHQALPALALVYALRAFDASAGIAVPALTALAVSASARIAGVAGVPLVEEAALLAGLWALGVDPVPAVLGVLLYGAYRFLLTALPAWVLEPRVVAGTPRA